MIKPITTFLILIIFFSCNDNHEVTGSADKIEYTALKDFSYSPSDLSSGTALRIIGYSGWQIFTKQRLCVSIRISLYRQAKK